MDIIDIHVFWGEWPFSNTGFWDGARLSARLKAAGISKAFVSPFGHCICKDEFDLDQRFLADLDGNGFFLPVAGLNLSEAYWPERLARIGAEKKFAGIILHPATRHFRLDDQTLVGSFFRCLRAQNIRQPIFVSVGIEEQRMRPLALAARPVGAEPIPNIDPLTHARGDTAQLETELAAFVRMAPADIPIVMLGMSATDMRDLIATERLVGKRIFFDTANMDSGALDRWRDLKEKYYCFGSFCPVLAPEGALWTLDFSIDRKQRAAICARGLELLPSGG